jgi:hypothetical protein
MLDLFAIAAAFCGVVVLINLRHWPRKIALILTLLTPSLFKSVNLTPQDGKPHKRRTM